MSKGDLPSKSLERAVVEGPLMNARAPYEPPALRKKRSVARVTLFSGSGASGASGLTSA
jgi:hypothetical protein